MSDPVQATPAAPADQRDSKSVAGNIVQGIQGKANGKPAALPPTNGQQPPATPPPDPNAGKEKYVVEGKEIWLTPEQARAYVQKGIAFEPKVDQLNRLQRETVELLNRLKTDPLSVLFDKRIGHTPEAVMQRLAKSGQFSPQFLETIGSLYYEQAVVPAKMTPEQREAFEAKKQLEEYKTREASARDQAIKLENQRRYESAMSQIKANIAEAMKDSGLPNNDTSIGAEMARMVADVMRLANFQRQSITPKQAIEVVKTRIKAVQAAYYDHLDEESLVKELGEKNAEKVKKYFLKLVKEAEKKPVVPNGKPAVRSGERKTLSLDEFHDYLDELKKKR